MPEVNEESITTVPLLPEAEDISANDLLYLIQGLGADRDKKLTLGALAEFLSTLILLSKSVKTDMLDDNAVTSAKLADGITVNYLSTGGLHYDINGTVEGKNALVYSSDDVDLTTLTDAADGTSIRVLNIGVSIITVKYFGSNGTTQIEPNKFKEFVKVSEFPGRAVWAVSA